MLASKKSACRAVPSSVRVSVMRGPEARKPREDLTVPGAQEGSLGESTGHWSSES